MAGSRPFKLGFRNGSHNNEVASYFLGFEDMMKQILIEAEDRWLRPAEVLEILRNYQMFHISAKSPNKPASGSVFLFDRKTLRLFRNDGHNWRKNKWRQEVVQRLKIGTADCLCCSYACGVDNVNFQRRSYWLLRQDLKHIVFVHYLEADPHIRFLQNVDRASSTSETSSSFSSSFHGTSPGSTLSSAYEDAELEDNHQARSRFHLYPESPLTDASHYSQSSSYNPLSSPGEIAFSQETCNSLPIQQVNWENYLEQEEQLEPRILQMRLFNPDMEKFMGTSGNKNYPYLPKKPLIYGLENEESLKKVDSISSWIAKEGGAETDYLNLQSRNGMPVGCDYDPNMISQLQVDDADTLNPLINCINEFSPNQASANLELETKDALEKIENGLPSYIQSLMDDDALMSWVFQMNQPGL